MKKALITGITGQDGSFLAELLLDKGYDVHGLIRRASFSNTSRIDHLLEKKRITLHDGDLADSLSLTNVIGAVEPDEIYNLAAQSHVQVSFHVPEYSGDVDALGVLRMLEAVRILGLTKKRSFIRRLHQNFMERWRNTHKEKPLRFIRIVRMRLPNSTDFGSQKNIGKHTGYLR